MDTCKMAWIPDSELRGFFKGTTNCLSALLAAERYSDILDLLDLAPHKMWHYRQYGVKALAAMGKKAEAIRFAEERCLNDNHVAIALACEEVLLSSGLVDEAYRRYGLTANRAGTYLAWFRAVAKKYPHKKPAEILADLVEETPGEEGKWFAAAKSANLFKEAIELARRTPCDPRTLARAARDFAEKNPAFAIEAGMTAIYWLVMGYGYEITGIDVLDAYSFTMQAAKNSGCQEETKKRISELVAGENFRERFASQILARQLGFSQ
jgi:hypothetical protein